MITTVTTSTVSTITSTTTMIGFGAALGVVVVITLLLFLCVKELATANGAVSILHLGRSRRIATFFDVAIVPLVIAFVMIVAMEVVGILG